MNTDALVAHARARFDHAAARRVLKEKYEEESKKVISPEIIWDEVLGKSFCWIYLVKPSDFRNKSDWQSQHEWFKENLEKFYKFFIPKTKELERELIK